MSDAEQQQRSRNGKSLDARVAVLEEQVKEVRQERKDFQRSLNRVWLALIGAAASVLIVAAAALIQMGQYQERIDTTVDAVESLEQQQSRFIRALLRER